MAYNIVVCIKPVPDPKYYDKVMIDPETKTIRRADIPIAINTPDKNAIEAALQLRENFGGWVAVLSMAPPDGKEVLREALAMGVDEAYLLSDKKFGGADTLATSYTLYHGLKKIEQNTKSQMDLVFCGCESADGATAQVPSQLGEWLEWPHLWNVFSIEPIVENILKKTCFHIRTKIENGYMEWNASPPLVLGVARELNRPRFTSVTGIIRAKKKPLFIWNRDDIPDAEDSFLGLTGSPTQAGEIFSPDIKRSGKALEGTPEEIVSAMVKIVRSSGF
jgi:electron transfer flavoprotein beta subunit